MFFEDVVLVQSKIAANKVNPKVIRMEFVIWEAELAKSMNLAGEDGPKASLSLASAISSGWYTSLITAKKHKKRTNFQNSFTENKAQIL